MMKQMSADRIRKRWRKWSGTDAARWLIAGCIAGVLMLASPMPAAAQDDEESDIVDARLEGYGKSVTLEGSTALIWVLLLILGIVCIGPLFMNAKRTHLD